MSRIVISATDAGFFNSSPLGKPLAPNVFLKTAVNIAGLAQTSGEGWQSRESGIYADFGIDVVGNTLPVAEEKLGVQTTLTVRELVYYRMEDGEKIIAGVLRLPEPLSLTATYDQLGPDSFGWRADVGNALEDVLKIEGFHFTGGEGNDVFTPHSQILPMIGDNVLSGRGGDDHLTGTLGNDRIWGGTGDDVLFDPDGVNFIFSGAGDDYAELGDGSDGGVIRGGTGNDVLVSGKGSDHLIGNAGRDILIGGGGNDTLDGMRASDVIDGGRGDDVISGGRGSDLLTGGEGADRFVFDLAEPGRDVITDFTDGEDLLVLQGGIGFDALSLTQVNEDVVISWGWDTNSITLQDVDLDSIGIEDFLFQ